MPACPKCGGEVKPGSIICPACRTNQPPALPNGTVLKGSTGSYEVGQVLGIGGFGITYKGRSSSGKDVAIKEFFPSRDKSVWARRESNGVTVAPYQGKDDLFYKGRMSFVKEAQVVSKLDNSPSSIVKGIEYMEMNNTAYLILDFLPGVPLFRQVQSRPERVISPKELFPKLWPLMDGISWLHSHRIIHRDVCPDNIMWTPNNELILMDFGSAREVDTNMTGFFKPNYAPIEQIASTAGKIGDYTDVFSLAGSILYCLTGRDPVSSSARMYASQDGAPDPLVLPDCLSEEQKAVFRRAMGLRIEDRYKTMAEFKNALQAAPYKSEPKPPKPGPTPKPGPASKPVKDKSSKLLIGVLIAIALVVVAIVIVLIAGAGDIADVPPELPAVSLSLPGEGAAGPAQGAVPDVKIISDIYG